MDTLYGMPVAFVLLVLATVIVLCHVGIWSAEFKPIRLHHITIERAVNVAEKIAVGICYVIIGCGLGVALFAFAVMSHSVRF